METVVGGIYFFAFGGGGGGTKVLAPKMGGAMHTLGGRLVLASASLGLIIFLGTH